MIKCVFNIKNLKENASWGFKTLQIMLALSKSA